MLLNHFVKYLLVVFWLNLNNFELNIKIIYRKIGKCFYKLILLGFK